MLRFQWSPFPDIGRRLLIIVLAGQCVVACAGDLRIASSRNRSAAPKLTGDAWQSQLRRISGQEPGAPGPLDAADSDSDADLPPLPSEKVVSPSAPFSVDAADGDPGAAPRYFPGIERETVPASPDPASGPCLFTPEAIAAESDADRAGLFHMVPHALGPISVEAIYTGEVFSNTRGGINTNRATRYRGNLDLSLTADLEALTGWKGASFFLYGGQLHGESLSIRDLGDWQLASNIDPFPYVNLTQLHEYWLRQELWDGRLAFKVGRQDANADFGFADLGGDFVNSSFATMPTIPLNVWPAQSLGASAFFNVTENVTLAGGVYRSNKFNQFWGDVVPGDRDLMLMGHAEWRTQFGPKRQLPGTWRVGAWADTSDWQEITTAPDVRVFDHNYGVWFCGDQLLWKESDNADDEQGVGAFFEFGWAPSDRNFVEYYYGAGVVYRGLLPGRDDDTCGLGVADVRFGRQTFDRDGLDYETAVELFYKAQLTEFIVLQPDVQYIANPGGAGRDSIFAGLRFELVL